MSLVDECLVRYEKEKALLKKLWGSAHKEIEANKKKFHFKIINVENETSVLKKYYNKKNERLERDPNASNDDYHIAALFYFAFTEETNGNYAFRACEGSNINLGDIVEITHCTALQSVCDALNIVLEKVKENKILNQLINKIHNERKLSIDGLATYFKLLRGNH
ncbi:MAG: hypothetical protein LBC87_01920 [Fibromonadaceae bacterium]|jgi:hypothetical protein|nr:hypothetical protein [Fibromonadaceae bacterium]